MQTINQQTLRADQADKNRRVLPALLPAGRRHDAAPNPRESKVEALYRRMFRRRISTSKFDQWCARDQVEEAPRHGVRERLSELLDHGRIVTTGWTATSVRGYHTHWIIWRKRSSPNNKMTDAPNKGPSSER